MLLSFPSVSRSHVYQQPFASASQQTIIKPTLNNPLQAVSNSQAKAGTKKKKHPNTLAQKKMTKRATPDNNIQIRDPLPNQGNSSSDQPQIDSQPHNVSNSSQDMSNDTQPQSTLPKQAKQNFKNDAEVAEYHLMTVFSTTQRNSTFGQIYATFANGWSWGKQTSHQLRSGSSKRRKHYQN